MRIHIVARDIQRHDAVGNFCRQIAGLLTANGAEVLLAAENCHRDDRSTIRPLPQAIRDIAADDIVFFHFSTEDPVLPTIAKLRNPKVLYFHNITPARYLLRSDPDLAGLVRRGLAQRPFAGRFDVLIANSNVTAGALRAGLLPGDRRRIARSDIIICPPIVGVDQLARIAATPVRLPEVERLILAVGRIVPHKGVEDLLRGFIELARGDANVGLAIAGGGADSAYLKHLEVQVESSGLDISRRVAFFHSIPDGTLRFLYDRASVCASMSRHEGFGVPLVDAIVFDKPLVIRAEPAMMATAGDAALVVSNVSPPNVAAALAAALYDASDAARLAAARQRRLTELRGLADGRLILGAIALAKKSKKH